MSMTLCASSNAPAACLLNLLGFVRDPAGLPGQLTGVHDFPLRPRAVFDSACSALAFNASRDSEWASVSCASAAIASASC